MIYEAIEMWAMLSDQGTACDETALCAACFNAENRVGAAMRARRDVVLTAWHDCTGNEALSCTVCVQGEESRE